MNLFCSELNKSFASRKVIKLIAGIDNLDISSIYKMVRAAELSGITYVDIAANTKVVQLLKLNSSLPICVSSISPLELYNCVVAGADVVELGNFDFCYKQGIYLTSSQILTLAKEVLSLVGNIDVCVTIPYYMSLHEQIELSQELEFIGVKILQTESVFMQNRLVTSPLFYNNTYYSLRPACSSLLSTYFISHNVHLPVISSSGINSLSSPLALSCGAAGVGVSSSVKKQGNICNMVNYLKSLYYFLDSMNYRRLFKYDAKLINLISDTLDSYTINDIMVQYQ